VQKPSVGRIVHYVSRGSADGKFAPECRAAIVTEVAEDGRTVGLCVANPAGLFFHPLSDGGAPYDPGDVDDEVGYMVGTGHCPARDAPSGSTTTVTIQGDDARLRDAAGRARDATGRFLRDR
jgi:hypothetical protein